MRLFWILLLVVWTLVGAIDGTDPATRIVSSGNSGGQCAAKGLLGECNGCVCCCHGGDGGILKYTPDKCECKRSLSQTQILVTLTLGVIVTVPTILASCFFGGRCRVSPYKPERPVQTLPRHQFVEMAPLRAPPVHASLSRATTAPQQ